MSHMATQSLSLVEDFLFHVVLILSMNQIKSVYKVSLTKQILLKVLYKREKFPPNIQ